MSTATPLTPHRRRRAALGLATALTMAASLLMFTATPATAADPVPDGLSSLTAAGSCWEIKQNYAELRRRRLLAADAGAQGARSSSTAT